MNAESIMSDVDVAVVGAGPIGLLLAGLLGQAGLRVLVIERRAAAPSHSQAIGVTPPSLKILGRLGLDDAFIANGVPIRDCHVHGQSGWLGCASFREIEDRHRFILSLPQQINVRLLEECVAVMETVTIRREVELMSFEEKDGRVRLDLQSDGKTEVLEASWLVGCDGHRSRVREQLGVPVRRGDYGCHFVMGDFEDRTDLGEEAHLFFTSDGAVESFPLPGGNRRWIVQVDRAMPETEPGFISRVVEKRSGIALPSGLQRNQSWFSPRWLDCDTYIKGRILLCGDAAHLMSPIGGQGMNSGWADAEFLADALVRIIRHQAASEPLLRAYDQCRHKAVQTSTRRAASGMWLGTRKGRLASWVRDLGMRHLLFKGPLAKGLGPFFAMLTIPYNTTEAVPWQKLGLPSPRP